MAAAALGVASSEIVFTGSGTEAVNLALLGSGRRLPAGTRIATWAAEHQAVLGACRQLSLEGHPLDILPVDKKGRNQPLAAPVALVSTSLANNEVGTLQPPVKVPGALVHLDACQGPEWVRPDLDGVDLASFSGAKIGAGGGGLLFVRDGVRLQPLQYGGPQERGRRAGREDVRTATAVAVALAACARRRAEMSAAARPLAARLRQALVAAGGHLTGGAPGLPNFASAVFPGRRGEDMLLALDLGGVAVSSGSACASGSLDPSHVLLAMGFSLEDSLAGLRLTVGWTTTERAVDGAVAALQRVLGPGGPRS
ncbi:MAG: cysteine desulfurase family protein [Candidatus Dormibacteraceae bacterium]